VMAGADRFDGADGPLGHCGTSFVLLHCEENRGGVFRVGLMEDGRVCRVEYSHKEEFNQSSPWNAKTCCAL